MKTRKTTGELTGTTC